MQDHAGPGCVVAYAIFMGLRWALRASRLVSFCVLNMCCFLVLLLLQAVASGAVSSGGDIQMFIGVSAAAAPC